MARVLVLLLLLSPNSFASSLSLGVGRSRTVEVPGATRAAVANGKILKVKAFNGKLWLSGLRVGRTDVQVWDAAGAETSFAITVAPSAVEDEPEPVVKVALEFLELDGALSRNVGLRWPDAIQFSGAGNAGSQVSGLNFSVAFASTQGWIQHLVREGWGRILAKPDLYVRLGEEALFHSGGEMPVANSSENFGRIHRNIQWKPYGLTVKVRPKSVDYLHISSDIDVEISEVSQSRAVDGVPGLTKRSLNTKMQSEEGQTVILSGLVRQAEAEERATLPVLGSIPFLGPLLFGSKNETSQETEVFMAVTFSFTARAREEAAHEVFRKRFRESRP